MSLILDALKRAENERESIRQSAALPAVAASVPPLPSRRRAWVLGAIAAVMVVAVTVIVMRQPASPPNEAVLKAETAKAPELEPPVTAGVTPIPGSEDVTSLDDVTEPEELSDNVAEPPAITPAPVPTPAAAPVATVEPPPASPPVVATSKTLKPLREMPSSYRAEFPDLVIQVHSYDNDAATRFVRIGGYRYKEGETLAEGPRLLEIVRNGLVLEYRGERVIYPLD